jgi:hypothetical protein
MIRLWLGEPYKLGLAAVIGNYLELRIHRALGSFVCEWRVGCLRAIRRLTYSP